MSGARWVEVCRPLFPLLFVKRVIKTIPFVDKKTIMGGCVSELRCTNAECVERRACSQVVAKWSAVAKSWIRRTFFLPNSPPLWTDERWSQPNHRWWADRTIEPKKFDWCYADDPIYDRVRNEARADWIYELELESDWLINDLWNIVCEYAADAAFLRYRFDNWKDNVIWISPFGSTKMDAKSSALSYRWTDFRQFPTPQSVRFREVDTDFTERKHYLTDVFDQQKCDVGWMAHDNRSSHQTWYWNESRWITPDRRVVEAANEERAIVERAVKWTKKRSTTALFERRERKRIKLA
jgi:hypothetical protein